MKQLTFFAFISLLMTACVSKKKHQQAIQSLQRHHQDTLTTLSNSLKRQLRYAKDSISTLRLNLAERKGENNVLNTLRGELQQQIEQLELQIESLSSHSQSSQNQLNQVLQQKDKEIARLKGHMKAVEKILNARQAAYKKIAGDLLFALQEIPFEDFETQTSNEGLKVIFPKKVFFNKGTTGRINKDGLKIMEAAAAVFNRYPIMDIYIVGHSSNEPTGRKSIKNNWALTAFQAATIVHTFADEYDLSTSQLTACGKGEFEPRSSNDTPQGKALNNRIEWKIVQRDADLVRAIKKELGI
ncbi:MAG TPA: hypothetical protein ENJ45_05620 [Phaeodactylibacter sp.]|nr:hypothetical protein [Phaeodactylibacter sp.]